MCTGSCLRRVNVLSRCSSSSPSLNSPGADWRPILVVEVLSPTAALWVRLGDVRAAHLRQASLAPDEAADLQLILGRLPPPWRDMVTAPHPRRSEWLALPLSQDSALPLFTGPDPMSGVPGLWELWPSGRLHQLPSTAMLPLGPGRPASVALRPKDRSAWDRADLDYLASQVLLPPSERRPVLEPWLLGLWPVMQLDPAVWGISPSSRDPVSLAAMSVRDARRHLSHTLLLDSQRSDAGYVRGYTEAQAAWPRVWRVAPVDAVAAPLDQCGLEGLEARWLQSATEEPDAASPPDQVDWVPPWLDLRRQAPQRPSRADRAAARELADVAPPALRPGFAAVWRRLDDSTLHRPFRITCWQILHGCLGCKAFLAHVRRRAPPYRMPDRAMISCDAPGCAAAGALETLTHTFLTCPAVVPAIDWLLATWELLAQSVVPRCARVLVADDLLGWANRPRDPGTLRLWTRLRVAVLGAIWQVRCSRDALPGESFARRAVRLAVQHLLGAIRRDWSRTQGDLRMADAGAFCVDWWRGFDVAMSVEDFVAQWAQPPLLCRVVGSPPAPGAADQRQLELRLSLEAPAALPP